MASLFQNRKPRILGLGEAPSPGLNAPTQNPAAAQIRGRFASGASQRNSFGSLARENNGPGFFGGNFSNNGVQPNLPPAALENASPTGQENGNAFTNADGLTGSEFTDRNQGRGQDRRNPFDNFGFGRDRRQDRHEGRREGRRRHRMSQFRSKIFELFDQFKAENGISEETQMTKELRSEFRTVFKDQLDALRNEFMSSRFRRFGQDQTGGSSSG